MSFRSLGLLAVLAAVLCFGSTAAADTITFQDGLNNPLTGSPYAGTDDNKIVWFSHTAGDVQAGQHEIRNYGTAPDIRAGINGGDRTYKAKSLIRFDLTSLAGEYASIDSVKLRLYVTGGVVDHANSLQLFRFTAANGDWLEGPSPDGLPYNADAAIPVTHRASCWNYRTYNTAAWASGTAGTDLTDYESGTIAATAFSSAAAGWVELVFTDVSFIGDWAAGSNPGMALRVEDESKDSRLEFYSSDYATDASLRPQLVIGYTPIPEPSTLALLATGLIGLLCYAWRKRK